MANETTLRVPRATFERTPFESGGDLALDFANSIDARGTTESRDLLTDYESVVGWCRHRAVISESERRTLVAHGRANRDGATRAHRRALELRETLFALFCAVAEQRPLPADALARLERLAHEASMRRALVPNGDGATWKPQVEPGELDSMRPVVEAATVLLTSERVPRITICEGANCSRLFIDNSRRQNRRWCDMTVCGNRAKARRHHARTMQATGRAPSSRSKRPTAANSPSPSPARTPPKKVREVSPPDAPHETEVREDDGFVWL